MSGSRAGNRIYDFCERIFPICRSVTGEGVRKMLKLLDEHISDTGYRLNVTEVSTGTSITNYN